METISDIPSKQRQPDSVAGADPQDTKKRTSSSPSSTVGASSAKAARRSPTRKTAAGLNGHGRKGSGSGLEGGSLRKPGASSASSLVNYLFYLLCITSLGATIYSNIRQSYLEDRLFSLVSIEERLSVLESQIRDVHRSSRRAYGAGTPRSREEQEQEESVSDVVRKISLQIAELPRIRRDVSALKLSRATRQASIQPMEGECMCPPGESLISAEPG